MKMRSCYIFRICQDAEESQNKTSTKRKVNLRIKNPSNNKSKTKNLIQPI